MFEERENHCHLYGIEPKYQAALKTIEEKEVVIKDQRDNINIMLYKINRYHKLELKDYPKEQL
jgi:hypothetical protein